MTFNKGLKTWLPQDLKKQNLIKKQLINLYEAWSYEPIKVETLVDIDTIHTANRKFNDKTFSFLDKNGEMLALRTELTQPIAKTIASRINEIQLPLRLYYDAEVFRYTGTTNTDASREIEQLGIEHIGNDHNFSDHEILQLFVDSLKPLKLTNYIVSLTDTRIWQHILDKYSKNNLGLALYQALLQGDLVYFQNLCEKHQAIELLSLISFKHAKEYLLQQTMTSSNDDHAQISNLNSNAANYIKILSQILNLDLTNLMNLVEIDSNIIFEPAQCPDLQLYTGLHFTLYTPDIGSYLGMGGRYDNLYKSFGVDLKAIGFAYYMPRVFEALTKQNLIADFEHTVKPTKINLTDYQSWQEVYQVINQQTAEGKNISLCKN
jgi:ATP phosphoribosyltransferase regulatory subunit